MEFMLTSNSCAVQPLSGKIYAHFSTKVSGLLVSPHDQRLTNISDGFLSIPFPL